MEFVTVCEVSDIPANQMRKVIVNSKEILLANIDGSYYAIANKCSHLGGSLAKGTLDGSTVTCPRHGARFDLITGKSIREAKIALIKMKVKNLESFQVKVDGKNIMVGIPE